MFNLVSIIGLTKGCAETQFTCTNGQCVPNEARCNNIRECRDGSDEFSCGNNDFILLLTEHIHCIV